MILVTGANGQLGRAFQKVLPDARIVGRDELDLTANINEIKRRVRTWEPSLVINTAAYTAVDKAEVDSVTAYHVNSSAVGAMAEACNDLGVRFVTYSTDYVFSGVPPHGGSWQEGDETKPLSIYGTTKEMGEQKSLIYPTTTVIRTSWVYGDGSNFVKTMLRLGGELGMPEVKVVSDQVGRPTNAWDLAEVTLRILQLQDLRSSVDGFPQIFHISNTGVRLSWADFAEEIFQMAGLPTKVRRVSTEEYLEDQAGKTLAPRPFNSVFDLHLADAYRLDLPHWRPSLLRYIEALG